MENIVQQLTDFAVLYGIKIVGAIAILIIGKIVAGLAGRGIRRACASANIDPAVGGFLLQPGQHGDNRLCGDRRTRQVRCADGFVYRGARCGRFCSRFRVAGLVVKLCGRRHGPVHSSRRVRGVAAAEPGVTRRLYAKLRLRHGRGNEPLATPSPETSSRRHGLPPSARSPAAAAGSSISRCRRSRGCRRS